MAKAAKSTAAAGESLDLKLRRHVQSQIIGCRNTRYSYWVHARELADYLLPRRYKWVITPNQASRGSPINQHILDSAGTLAARNLASGLVSGVSSPSRPWIKLKIGHVDSTGNNPISLWLAEVERIMMLVFQESNFYDSIAVLYFDLVVFGTGVLLIYEDFNNVIHCFNPCFGEYYVALDGKLRPKKFYREFTMTISQVVNEFGVENCSTTVQRLWKERGPGLEKEIIVAHAIEPNDDDMKYGFPEHFAFRECYWEWGNSSAIQPSQETQGFLRKKGFHESPAIIIRWDLVSNDPYGRSPGMDALPDVKQLQLEARRKGQAIDKGVNPPMVADAQLKNQPASFLPGGTTYITGMLATGNDGMKPAYGNWKPEIQAISEDLQECRERIKEIFFNHVLQVISQYETRSNVSATEIDARRAEALILLGPVLGRIQHEGLDVIIDRVFGMGYRAGIFPPPPQEVQGAGITVEYISILAQAQAAAAATGIERTLQLAGNLAALDPSAMDKIDTDFTLDNYSTLMNNHPRVIRSNDAVREIRLKRQQQQQAAQLAEQAKDLAPAAKNLADIDVGGGQSALQKMTGL